MCANILNIHPFLWSGTGISLVLCVGPYGVLEWLVWMRLQKESRPRWQKPRLQYPASACHCICSKWQTGSYSDLFFRICKLGLLYFLTLVKGFIESDFKIMKLFFPAALNPASVDLGRLLVSILDHLLIVYSMYFPLLHLSIYLFVCLSVCLSVCRIHICSVYLSFTVCSTYCSFVLSLFHSFYYVYRSLIHSV